MIGCTNQGGETLEIHKHYVLDEDRNPIAVQVPINEFRRIEEALESFGLARLMDETRGEETLSREDALACYEISLVKLSTKPQRGDRNLQQLR